MVYTENTDFEWDFVKAVTNVIKHKVTFEQAVTVFDDPFVRFMVDDEHSMEGEVRKKSIGLSDRGILVVVFTIRHPGKTRIISARKANKKERKLYEEKKI